MAKLNIVTEDQLIDAAKSLVEGDPPGMNEEYERALVEVIIRATGRDHDSDYGEVMDRLFPRKRYAAKIVVEVEAEDQWGARDKATDFLMDIPANLIARYLTDDPYILDVESNE